VFVLPLQYSGTADANSNLSKLVDYYAYEKDVVLALASGNDYSYPTIFGDAYTALHGGLMDAAHRAFIVRLAQNQPRPNVDGRNKPTLPHQQADTQPHQSALPLRPI
jgi:hypothetical protein